MRLADLDAIAFGRGPGAFTGLRTACSVAQGLAFGAAKPVLPIDSLMAIAEDARRSAPDDALGLTDASPLRVWAVLDARMNEIYAAEYEYGEFDEFAGGRWRVVSAPMLIGAAALNERWHAVAPRVVAGNALDAYAESLDTRSAWRCPNARPRAVAMLALARAGFDAGDAVDAALGLPVYLRDKVAQTTLERTAERALRSPAQPAPAQPAPSPTALSATPSAGPPMTPSR